MKHLSKHLRAGRFALALLAGAGATFALPISAASAQTASLIADHVRVDGNGGLGQVQPFSRLGNAQFFGHRHKYLKLMKCIMH